MFGKVLKSLSVGVALFSVLACGGIWDQAMSEAAVETLQESRVKIEACDGDGQPAALATIDSAISMAQLGQVGFSELVLFDVAIDEVVADGTVDAAEATSLATKVAELAAP